MRKRLLLSTLILFVASSLQVEAMQFGRPNAPQSTPPGRIPGGTPPTFPSDSHPSSTLPPDTAAPPATSSSDFKIEGQIQAPSSWTAACGTTISPSGWMTLPSL